MKVYTVILLTLLTITTGGCNSDPTPSALAADRTAGACAGIAVLGTWQDTSGDTLTLNSDCTGSRSQCSSSFTYTVPNEFSDQTDVSVSVTQNFAACWAVGSHNCTFDLLSSTQLHVTCGGQGVVDYRR